MKLFFLFICSWRTSPLVSKFFTKAHAPHQKYTSSIRSIPLNSTTLFTCTFLDPARFNLHERVARTSIKRIVELFAIVYLPKKDTFTDGEAWRKIAIPHGFLSSAFTTKKRGHDFSPLLSSKRRRHAWKCHQPRRRIKSSRILFSLSLSLFRF